MANFAVFYQAAFLVPLILLLVVGIQRNYDMSRWLPILLASSLFFLLGTRISTFSFSDWQALFRQGVWPGSAHKFALGGLILALAGIGMIKSYLGFDQPVLTVFAWVAPIGLAIQKLGCLFGGCCFGRPTSLPWGFQYASGTAPHYDHLVEGLISQGAQHSLPVHPTPIYQMVVYLAISASVLIAIRRLRRTESAVPLALVLMFGARFLLEFLIDHQATVFGGYPLLGLKPMQWFLLLGFFTSSIAFILSERKVARPPIRLKRSTGKYRPFVVLAFVAMVFIMVNKAFTYTEILAFNVRFALITVLFVVVQVRHLTPPRLRWISLTVLALPLILGSQTIAPNHYNFEKEILINGGFSVGRYFNEARYNPHAGYCGTAYDRAGFENTHVIGGAGVGITGRQGFRSYAYGSYLFAGTANERRLDMVDGKQHVFLSLSPYANYNWRWLGIGVNLHMGSVPFTPMDNVFDTHSIPESNLLKYQVLPGFSARVGPYDWFDLRVRYASGFPILLPGQMWDISIGSGFGMKNGSGLRFGITSPLEDLYFEGRYAFSRLDLTLIYTYGKDYMDGLNSLSHEFRLGAGYRLSRGK